MVESLQPGARIDRYEVEQVMASGGHGTVARVRHVHLGSLHALKVLRVEKESYRARLLREGRIQASLRHANIVGVTDVVAIEQGLALVMEYVDGPDLFRWLQRHTPSVEEVDLLAEQLFAAFGEAHARGIIHRDIKPDNVLVERAGDTLRLRVTDFGLAVDEGDTEGRLTMDGIAMGTPRYMAPELYVDARTADARADLYGLGALLYELLAGEPPFAMGSVVESYGAAVAERFVPLSSRRPEVPARMEAAVVAAMRASPDARPADIAAMHTIWRGDTPPPTGEFSARALLAAAPRMVAPMLPPTRSLPEDGSIAPAPHPSLVPGADPTQPTSPEVVTARTPTRITEVSVPRLPLVWLAAGMLGIGGLLSATAVGGWAWYFSRPDVAVEAAEPTAPTAAPAGADAPVADAPGAEAPGAEVPGAEVPGAEVPPAEVPPAAPAPTPAAAPVNDVAAPIAAPATAPVAAAAAPAVAAPVPTPKMPAPEPSHPIQDAPRPTREPARVSVTGVARARLKAADGAPVATSAAPPGAYMLEVWFAGDVEPTQVMSLTLGAGERRTVRCAEGLRTCQ